MKRKSPIIITIVIAIIACCFIGIYIFLDIKFGWQIWISRRIKIFVPLSVEVEYKDNHGGFHGDGECLVKVYFSKEQAQKFKEKIERNSHWKQLPMSDRFRNQLILGIEKEMEIPVIKNGYYYFLDRHSQADDKYNPYEMDEEFRGSWNYTVAVFDTDENILYFYELDT